MLIKLRTCESLGPLESQEKRKKLPYMFSSEISFQTLRFCLARFKFIRSMLTNYNFKISPKCDFWIFPKKCFLTVISYLIKERKNYFSEMRTVHPVVIVFLIFLRKDWAQYMRKRSGRQNSKGWHGLKVWFIGKIHSNSKYWQGYVWDHILEPRLGLLSSQSEDFFY